MRYGSVVPAERRAFLGRHPSGIGDQAVDQRHVGAVQAALVDERALGVFRDEHFAGEASGRRVGGRGIAGVAGRGQRDRLGAEIPGASNRRRLPARLERVGRVERFVLDVQPIEADGGAERLGMEQRREPFTERHRRLAVEQRQHLAIAPHVRLAAGQRVARPCPRPRQVVAGEQRGAARAQVMTLMGIERRRTARHRAFEVRKERQGVSARAARSPSSSADRRCA